MGSHPHIAARLSEVAVSATSLSNQPTPAVDLIKDEVDRASTLSGNAFKGTVDGLTIKPNLGLMEVVPPQRLAGAPISLSR
jgi:hypothetical protein